MSESSGNGKAFVLFSVGPVQSFIASARTVRDLWTGSFLLAWLTRHAMEPILKQCDSQAFVLPDMSRDPLPLEGAGGSSAFSVRAACLPNRFLAEVPEDGAEGLAEQCKQKFLEEWQRISKTVRESLDREVNNYSTLSADWQESADRLWLDQVESFFDLRVVVLPWSQCTPQLLEELLGPADRNHGGSTEDELWSDRRELVFRLLAAQKAIRKVTRYQPKQDPLGMYAPKCTLLGTYEQLGPSEVSKSAEFWQTFAECVKVEGIRLRRGERLSAPSLVKRFAWPAYLAEQLPTGPEELRFEDTATVAAAEWLLEEPRLEPNEIREKYKDWNGQWLHWNRHDQDPDDPCPQKIWNEIWPIIQKKRSQQGGAPAYYGILMIDGDRMGQVLNAKVGPEHPRKISRILAQFTLDHAERIVDQCLGTLIYCGGDDLLALLPTRQVLGCAQEVQKGFTRVWQAQLADLQATLSGGIAIVHYKEDLRFALEQARLAEKQAKQAGRNILCIRLCRRSGEHQTALCPWDFVETVQGWVNAFSPVAASNSPAGKENIPGASDRWAYHLYQELPVLEGLPLEAIEAELRRQMDRAEEATRKRLFGNDYSKAGAKLVGQFKDYYQSVHERFSTQENMDGKILRHFLTLCQMASFLARRREE